MVRLRDSARTLIAASVNHFSLEVGIVANRGTPHCHAINWEVLIVADHYAIMEAGVR